MLFPEQNVPRWIIFLIDSSLVFISLFAAYMLRFEFTLPDVEVGPLIFAFPIFMIVRLVSFLIGKTYAGIIRYSGTEDSLRIIKVILGGSAVFALLNPLKYFFWDEAYFLPFSIIIIEGLISTVLLILFRLSVKMLYIEIRNPRSERSNVIIYGAGEAGAIAKQALNRDAGTQYKVVAFVDDDSNKTGKRLEGTRVYHTSELDGVLRSNEVASLIVSIQNPNPDNQRKVVNAALKWGVKVLNVPPVNNWINGELSFKQIKEVKIEDLLGRKVIELDDGNVEQKLKDEVVLVTGAAGSIGSGLVRRIALYQPKLIIALDQAESPLYELEIEMHRDFPNTNFEFAIGDIRRKDRMVRLFEKFRPTLVFHAAAYKHVPLMEENPTEAVLTNVLGTKTLVDLSMRWDVKRFVFVSTDKAVNPTSVMGSSKRVAEIYAQSNNKKGSTLFITTRFGNVLGSNGSVIPLFKKQIDNGGPITVTHPDVTRYFMTIPEACQLVLEAGAMGEGGEIYVFDMGESVKIIDLANQMIKLSGLEAGKDIEIKFTGLRPGEKLYEELLNKEEDTLPTHHPQIKRAKVRAYELATISHEISELIELFNMQDNDKLVEKIKSIVPEYISNNSEFSKFDMKRDEIPE